MKNIKIIMLMTLTSIGAFAQQESQYSQYMYNTMTFNPGYTGSREVISALGLYRTQWVGLDGAPENINFSIQAPVGYHGNGIGLDITTESIGPSKTAAAMVNYAYTILGSNYIKYSFGIAAGFQNVEIDYTKLNIENPDPYMQGSLSRFSPNVGAGFYVHSNNWYVGISIPKLLKTDFYDDVAQTVHAQKKHVYLMGGYVFDINPYLKFKPAAMIKAVSGAPLSVDVSANFLIQNKVTLGMAYRLDASISALAGIQVTDGMQIGYGYDYDTTGLGNYNSGSHELFLRFDLFNASHKKMVNPRFF
ncbi:MAG: type IX secretion system membrane protein PorP/SprF [Flavobacterium sp.]